MKPWLLTFFVFGWVGLGQPALAQDIYVPFKVDKLPIEFKYEKSFPPREVKRYSYIASDGQSEFYIKITRIGPEFTADSLKMMFFKLYDEPDIKNLQVRELGEVMLGGKKTYKCVLAFMAKDKWYLSTTYMVPFYINARYNSLLFYFEMGELRAPSYTMIQEKMIETLRYTDFSFTDVKEEGISYTICMPEVWEKRLQSDETKLILTDDRAALTVRPLAPSDTLPPGKLADIEKDKMKADPKTAGLKVKAGTEKVGRLTVGKITFTFEEARGRRSVRMLRNVWLVPVSGLREAPGYRVEFTCPEETSSHYEPLLRKMLKCLDISGMKPFADL